MELVKIKDKTDYGIPEFLRNFTSEHTRKAYERDLKDFFKFFSDQGIGISAPQDLTLAHFISYRDALTIAGKAPASVNRKMASIRSLMKWFHLKGYIQTNPAMSLKLAKTSTQTPTQAFTDEEAIAMMEVPKNPSHKLILKLLFRLGLRRSELSGIEVTDIYESRGHTVLRIQGKGGKLREVPVTDELKEELDNQKKDAIGQNLFNITPSGLYKLVKRYAREAGIKKNVSPHSCRATVISQLLENEVSPRNVADLVGHSSINTTVEIYDKKRKGLDDSAAYKVKY